MGTVPGQAGAAGEGERRARLIGIVRAKSLIERADIKLASGASSSFYFDMKPTMFDPQASNLISDMILELLGEQPVDFVGGLEMGAVPIVAALAQRSFQTGRPIPGCFIRKTVKDHGTRRLIEGIAPDVAVAGKRVVLLEDVTTSGGSVLKAVAAVRDSGGIADTVITVVDRLEGASGHLQSHGIQLRSLLTTEDFGVGRG